MPCVDYVRPLLRSELQHVLCATPHDVRIALVVRVPDAMPRAAMRGQSLRNAVLRSGTAE